MNRPIINVFVITNVIVIFKSIDAWFINLNINEKSIKEIDHPG